MKDGHEGDQKASANTNVRPATSADIKDAGNSYPTAQDPEQQEQTPDHPFRLRHAPPFDRVTRIIALIGLAATIGTLGVNFYQLRAIEGQLVAAQIANTQYKRQADIADEALQFARLSAQSADRPWLIPIVRSISLPTSSQDITLYVDAQNSGKSPAIDAVEQEEVLIGDPTPPAFDVDPCTDCAPYVIGPSLGLTANRKISSSDLSDLVLNDIRSGSRVIYVHGRVDYDDVNKNHHHSTYCYFYNNINTAFSACARLQSNTSD